MTTPPQWFQLQREATMVLDRVAELRKDGKHRPPDLEERARDLVSAAVRVDPRPLEGIWRCASR